MPVPATASRAARQPLRATALTGLLVLAAAVPLTAQDRSVFAALDTEGRTIAPAMTLDGQLGASDLIGGDGMRVQVWSLAAAPGTPVRVALRSSDFDAYLNAVGPDFAPGLFDDDSGGGLDAQLCFVPDTAGEYRIVAASLDGSTGAFTLSVEEVTWPELEACATPVYDEDPFGASVSGDEVPIRGRLEPDTPIDGVLSASDVLYQGIPVQGWTLEAQAGDRFAVEMRSSDIDSYLHLEGPGFETPISDDDSAGNLDARLCVEVPETGTYRVFAGPLAAEADGARYTLTLRSDGGSAGCGIYTTTPELQSMRLAELSSDGRSVRVGEEADGRLALDEVRHPETGHAIQPWSLELAGGSTVYVDVVSDDFDPLVYAVGAGIMGELFNDDGMGADGCNSRLEIGPDVSGPVTLLVGSFHPDMGGRFLIRASENPPPLESGGCVDFAEEPFGGVSAGTNVLAGLSSGSARIGIGTERFGLLDASSEVLSSGAPAQTWSVAVEQGDRLVIELISQDFDPVLYLDGPGILDVLTDDDGMDGANARIETTAVLSGQLRIVATAFDPSATGRYRLRVIRQGG